MRLIVWALRAFIFFTLFAFALNNEQAAVVHWFFGAKWQAPMVIVVLASFAAGAAVGILAMLPSWWKHRRVARRHEPVTPARPAAAEPTTVTPSEFGTEQHPPREGL